MKLAHSSCEQLIRLLQVEQAECTAGHGHSLQHRKVGAVYTNLEVLTAGNEHLHGYVHTLCMYIHICTS